MKLALIAFGLLLSISTAAAAQQSCLCTSGCVLVSDPYPGGSNAPISCTAYLGGANYATSNTVLSSTIPVSNANHCLPASAAYNPGAAGSVACAVNIPPLVPGTYVFDMTTTNAAGTSPHSASFTFVSVSVLPVIPAAPVNLRVM